VFPLVKNKPEIVEKAKGLFTKLQKRYNVAWDTAGAIGRR
jgi:glycyl-tRNA synthetase